MKVGIKLVSLIIAVMLVVVGCSSSKVSLPEALVQATTKTMEANSYVVSGTIKINEFSLDENMASSEDLEMAAGVAAILKDATLNVNGVFSKDASRTDMNVELVLPGFMNMKLDVPLIVSEDKIYFKMPQIPMMPIPEELKDKFIVVDPKELAELEGAEAPELDMAKQQQFAQEISTSVLKHFDEKTYFTELKSSEAGLPEGVKADRVVKFSITEANYDQTVTTLVEKVLPEIFDLLIKNEAYLEAFELDKADLEEAKTDLAANKEEIVSVLKENVKVKQLDHTGAIKGGNLVYQETGLNLEFVDPDDNGTMTLSTTVTMNYSDINKAPKFETEIPTDAVPFFDFMVMMN